MALNHSRNYSEGWCVYYPCLSPTTQDIVSELILHPKTVALQKKVKALREELADLLQQRMYLIFEELPALRYRYTELFGPLEREIEVKTLKMSERKRLVELFALKLDRGQRLDQKMIDLTMKAVYNEFRRVRKQVERMAGKERKKAEGEGFRIPGLSDTKTTRDPEAKRTQTRRELRSLYRNLAKRLHPDRCQQQDALTGTYWEMTCTAYERADLDLLRMLANVVETGVGLVIEGKMPGPAEEAVHLIEIIDKEKKRLHEMTRSEPYTIRKKLDDSNWVSIKQQQLRDQLQGIEKEIEKCDQFLAPLMAGHDEEVHPDVVQKTWTSFVEDVYLSGRF